MAEDVKDVVEDAVNTDEPATEQPTGNSGAESERTYTQKEVDEMLKDKFTQEQVNDIVEKRLARVKKAEPNDDLKNANSRIEALETEIAGYKREVALSKYSIDEKYQDYIDFKVKQSGKDYATALKEFFDLEENKKYLVEESQPSRPVPRPKNSNSMENERAIDNDLRAMFGLAKK